MRTESPVVFECGDDRLLGMNHAGDDDATIGAVIAIGGPQYRAGSHRQFVLMARSLADAGMPVLRFDYRGMGDSEGEDRTFEHVDEDIEAAVSCLVASNPNVANVVLIGLCDAASAISMYASQDDRVRGLVLINPWVRTPAGEARSYVKHYYLQRLLQRGFWAKMLSGRLNVVDSMRQFVRTIGESRDGSSSNREVQTNEQASFINRMSVGLQNFEREVLILISGRDLTAREFTDLCGSDPKWRSLLNRTNMKTKHLADADHTMSSRLHLNTASVAISDWISNDLSI